MHAGLTAVNIDAILPMAGVHKIELRHPAAGTERPQAALSSQVTYSGFGLLWAGPEPPGDDTDAVVYAVYTSTPSCPRIAQFRATMWRR